MSLTSEAMLSKGNRRRLRQQSYSGGLEAWSTGGGNLSGLNGGTGDSLGSTECNGSERETHLDDGRRVNVKVGLELLMIWMKRE